MQIQESLTWKCLHERPLTGVLIRVKLFCKDETHGTINFYKKKSLKKLSSKSEKPNFKDEQMILA
jgi:hypothetical protein